METETIPEERSPLFSLLPLLHRLVLTPRSHKDYGYTKMQLIIFNALATRESLNMTQIADFIGASKEQATRAVAPMVNDGLVERSVPEENRTRVDIRLTPEGKTFMCSYFRDAESRIRERVGASLNAEERRRLRAALTTAAELLMKVN